MRAIYFHGGPGLNGNPERTLLPPAFARAGFDLHVWDEPSRLRPDGPAFRPENAWAGYLEAAEAFFLARYAGEPLVVLGHSFGVFPLRHLSRLHPDKIALAVPIGTDFALPVNDLRLLHLWKSDFARDGDPRAVEVGEVIERFSGQFDENTARGFSLGAQNPRLFDSYWYDAESRARFVACYAEPSYGVDIESFVAVRRSYEPIELVGSPIPAIAVFGHHERVVCKETEIRHLREAYADLTVHELPNSAHYPHVEETEAFLRIVVNAMETVARR